MPGHRFSSTNQPNNRGRPRGSKNKVSAQLRNALPEVVAKVIEQALAGCVTSQAAVLKYARPAFKQSQPVIQFKLTGETPAEKAESIIRAVAAGELPPDVASQLLTGLAACVKIKESENQPGDRFLKQIGGDTG